MTVEVCGPKVSVITAIRNGFELFVSTYESVVGQTHRDFEWIIVDDGSSPTQRDLIRGLVRDPRVTYIESEIGRGAGAARNLALPIATGNYVTFIDADDLWAPNFLEVMIGRSEEQGAPFIFAGYARIRLDGGRALKDFIPSRSVTPDGILAGCDISCLTAFLRRDVINSSVRFAEIPTRNDLAFFYRALLVCGVAFPVPMSLATYRMRPGSVSSSKLRALRYLFEVNRRIARKSTAVSVVNCLRWVFYGVRKYYI